MTAPVRIMIVAGGTGGHVFPGLAVAERLREAGAEVTWLGTQAGLEAKLVPPSGIEIDWISITGLRGKGALTLVLAPFKIMIACLQAILVILRRKPQLVLGMGGFVSGPGGLMAWLTGRTLMIHEQNARAGMTNRWLSPFAKVVFEAFPGSFGQGLTTEVVGNPVRQEMTELPVLAHRISDPSDKPRLLVVGGSLGARALNCVVPEAVAALDDDERPQILHQAGTRTIGDARERYELHQLEVDLVPFIDDMAEAYAWADLVICRAGALTVSEIAAVGVPAIFVPYPHAVDDHQTANARFLADSGAALMIPESELNRERLADAIRVTLGDRVAALSMAEKAHSLAILDADRKVARTCLDELGVAA